MGTSDAWNRSGDSEKSNVICNQVTQQGAAANALRSWLSFSVRHFHAHYMKFLVFVFTLAAAIQAFAADGERTIVTLDGTKYEQATISRVEPDGIRIIYSDGATKIPFERLSPELQKEFGYDPAKASQHRAAMNAANQQAAANFQKQKQLEARFATWVQELERKKQVALYAPTDILQRGGSKQDIDSFTTKSNQLITTFEARLTALRQLIAVLDQSGATYESTKGLIDAVYDEKVFIGMPAPFVRLSWGTPTDINSTLNGSGRSEQWIYRRGTVGASYVYVEDGIVRSIQN